MDPPARRGLVRYLSKLATSSSGVYRQLLVISHSSDTVDALPNRITITCDAKGNRRIEQT
jgi:DNA repair exonuclease SbcCD ATPase subunit